VNRGEHDTGLVDGLGRPINSARISVTDRCNMNCIYCHGEGDEADGREMSTEELTTLLLALKSLDVRKIKITGGEPLLRDDIVDVIAETSSGFEEVSLVTNGTLLEETARELAEAGLTRVNVSLDTVDPDLYSRITGTDMVGPETVLNGIREAIDVGLTPVKVNVVLLDEVVPRLPELVETLVEEVGTEGIKVQLIEPFHGVDGATVRDALRVLSRYRPRLVGVRRFHKRRVFELERLGLKVECVEPMRNEMCAACTRIRFTSSGGFKRCMYDDPEPVPLNDPREAAETIRTLVTRSTSVGAEGLLLKRDGPAPDRG